MDQETLARVPANTRAGLIAMNAGKPLAHLTDKTRPEFARSIVSRYLDGEEIADIAAEIGVTNDRLYQILIAGDSDAWRSAQAAKALSAFQSTKEQLESASDGLSLARARELHKSAQWQLEKLLRRLYGDDKTAINVNAAGQVSIQVISYSPSNSTAQGTHTIDNNDVNGA